jgi:gas vesicle protein
MDEKNHGHNFFTGLILGAIVGAGLYYFLTSTEEGKKIKTQLKEKGKDVLDDLTDLVEEIEEKGQEFKQKAKQVQTQLEQRARSVEGEVLKEAKGQLARIKELRERGRKAAKSFTRNGKPLS